MAGRWGGVSLCRLLLTRRSCGSVLPGTGTQGAGLRFAAVCARGFSTEDGANPAYTMEYFQGVINWPLFGVNGCDKCLTVLSW